MKKNLKESALDFLVGNNKKEYSSITNSTTRLKAEQAAKHYPQ